MSYGVIAVGLWFVALGAWAMRRALKANEITTLWPDKLSGSIPRDRLPIMFWVGIGFYALIIAIGVGFVLFGAAYLQTI